MIRQHSPDGKLHGFQQAILTNPHGPEGIAYRWEHTRAPMSHAIEVHSSKSSWTSMAYGYCKSCLGQHLLGNCKVISCSETASWLGNDRPRLWDEPLPGSSREGLSPG